MAIRAVWASGASRALSGGVAVVLTLLLSGCPEAVTGPDKATRLLFTIQPTSTVAGLPITPAVQVTAQDARGNPAAGFTGNVTVALGTNPAGGTLSGSTTVAAVAGVATFSTLSIDRVGSGYSFSAAATGLSSTTSATFAVTAGAATQLAFAVQPSTTTAGAGLQPAVQVTVQDALGNAVPGFTGQVSVAITAGTGRAGATLFGTKTVAPVAGVATFSNLSIDKSGSVKTGTGYTLSATAAGLTGVTSEPFDITPGAATQLVFSIQPRAAAAGAHIAPPVEVTALDVSGNLVPTFTGTVTVAIGTNPAGGTISGTTTVAAIAGVATISRLSIDRAGAGYTLSATTPGLSGTPSVTFSIVPAAASQLAFTVQPGTTTAGAMIRPA